MKHTTSRSDRIAIWKRPAKRGEWRNSLTDAFVSAKPGALLIYRQAMPTNGTPPPELKIAVAVASRLGGALVQWPDSPCRGDQRAVRMWNYAIQKQGQAA